MNTQEKAERLASVAVRIVAGDILAAIVLSTPQLSLRAKLVSGLKDELESLEQEDWPQQDAGADY